MKPKIHGAFLMRVFRMLFPLGPIIALSVVGAASAADMPIPASPASSNPPPILYAPAAFSWTGFYIGGNFGWDWTQISETATIPVFGTGSVSGNVRGFLGGGQVGYNWQVFQPLVIGIETDFQGSQATAGSRSVNGFIGPSKLTGYENTPYFGTVRGRVGYAYGTLLYYATAGVVYGDNTLRGTLPPIGSFSRSATFSSWTAGAGIEASLGGQFSAKLEYLFIGAPSNPPLLPGATTSAATSGTSLVRAGVNYRFW